MNASKIKDITINIEVKTESGAKHPTPHRAIAHYSDSKGNEQSQLQLLAADIMKYGKRVGECHHVSQEFFPNGDKRTVMTGSYCIEIINEISGSRYWVHFSGCRVTEIIEEYLKD